MVGPEILGELPFAVDVTSLVAHLPALPAHLFGEPTHWSIDARESLVSLGWTDVHRGGFGSSKLWFLGYACPIGASGLDQSKPRGSAVPEILVASVQDGVCSSVTSLVQWRTLTFQETDERGDSVSPRTLTRMFLKTQSQLPKWSSKASAHWPTHQGVPMHFLCQMRVDPRGPIADRFVAGVDVFAFGQPSEPTPAIKCMMLDYALQSAEDHYREEARRDR